MGRRLDGAARWRYETDKPGGRGLFPCPSHRRHTCLFIWFIHAAFIALTMAVKPETDHGTLASPVWYSRDTRRRSTRPASPPNRCRCRRPGRRRRRSRTGTSGCSRVPRCRWSRGWSSPHPAILPPRPADRVRASTRVKRSRKRRKSSGSEPSLQKQNPSWCEQVISWRQEHEDVQLIP